MSRLLPGPSPYTSPVDFGETIYCRESSEDGIRSEIYIGMDKGQEQIEGVAARSIEWPISGVGIGLEMVGSDLTLDDVSEIVEETEQQNVFECTDKQINPEMEANIRGLSEEVGGDVRVNEMQGIVLSIEADDILEFSDKGTSFEARDVAVMECAHVEEIKEGGLAKETTGFTEKLREEGRDHRRELRIVLNDGAEQEYKKAAAMSTEDVGTSVQAKDAGMKNKRKGIKKGKVEEKRAHELPKQNEKAIRRTTEGNAQKPGHAIHEGTESSEVPLGKGADLPSYKASDKDEKIWKQMEALRVIMGYRVSPQASVPGGTEGSLPIHKTVQSR